MRQQFTTGDDDVGFNGRDKEDFDRPIHRAKRRLFGRNLLNDGFNYRFHYRFGDHTGDFHRHFHFHRYLFGYGFRNHTGDFHRLW